MAGIYNASAKDNPSVAGKINNASLPNIEPLIQAGIDPKTGLPLKVVESNAGSGFKTNNKKLLRIIDEQDAINSFKWYNLPNGLSGNLIERILYYKGQGMFFYMEANDQFYFLPYALDGTIDVYGRFTDVTPLPFNGTSDDGKEGKKAKPWITGLTRKCIYDIKLDALKVNDLLESCVLLHDYSQQMSQTNISRQVLNDPLLDVMADCIPFMRTALLNSTGVAGMRVQSEDEQANVDAASRSIQRAALDGQKWIPIVGKIDFQDLASGDVAKSEEFLLAMQSLDNYRLSLHGLDNGGLFQKQSHILQAEQAMNQGKASLVMQDKLFHRQHFCDVVNSIWGLGIWCEPAETAINADMDMDGTIMNDDPETVSHEPDQNVEEGSDE